MLGIYKDLILWVHLVYLKKSNAPSTLKTKLSSSVYTLVVSNLYALLAFKRIILSIRE
jgi:hypothetical protein